MLRSYGVAPQDAVNRICHVRVYDHLAPVLYLDQYVESGRSATFQDRLLRPAAARLDVSQRNRLDAAHQIRESRVHDQIVQRIAVSGGDKLDSTFRYRARGVRVQLYADLIYYDDLRHVVLHRLDHHVVLEGW